MLSRRARDIQPSVTLSLTTRAKKLAAEGRDITAFGAGEPDFDTPKYIQDAAIAAIREGRGRYTPSAGIPELRAEIARQIKNTRGVEYSSEEIIVTAGGKQGIANIVLALLDEGDEAVIPAPYWVSYPEMVRLAGGKPVVVETDLGDDFQLSPDVLEKALTERTKILFLNTPSNPTGCIYGRESIAEILDVLKGRDVFIVSDEIYERLIYGGAEHVSPLAVDPSAKDRIILSSGVSKTYAMTGWRMGYAAGPEEVIKAAVRIQAHTTSCASSITQAAALAAYADEDDSVERMWKAFDERRIFMHEYLCSLDGVVCPEPLGAFYCFPDVSAHYGRTWGGVKVEDSFAFAEALLAEAGVAVIPGGGFGADAHIRFSYATGIENIEKGLEKFKNFLEAGR